MPSVLQPSNAFPGGFIPNHTPGQSWMYQYLYPGAVQPYTVAKNTKPFPGVAFPQHISGNSKVIGYQFPGAVYPITRSVVGPWLVSAEGITPPLVINTETTLEIDPASATYVLKVDTSNLALGDTLEARIYTKTLSGGGYVKAYKGVWQHAQINNVKISPPIGSDQSIEFTLKQTSGPSNQIRNPTMQGAVVGNPGTLPNNWFYSPNNGGTLATQIIATGFDNGVPYIDIQFSGTTGGAGWEQLFFEQVGIITSAAVQEWTVGAYVKLQAGALTNISKVYLAVNNFDRNDSFLSVAEEYDFTPTTSSLSSQFYSTNFSTNQSGTEYITSLLGFNFTGAVAINVTLRIGLPSLTSVLGRTIPWKVLRL